MEGLWFNTELTKFIILCDSISQNHESHLDILPAKSTEHYSDGDLRAKIGCYSIAPFIRARQYRFCGLANFQNLQRLRPQGQARRFPTPHPNSQTKYKFGR